MATHVLVIQGSAYGETDKIAAALEIEKISPEQRKLLHESVPSERVGLPGCDEDGNFATDYISHANSDNGEMDPPGNLGLRWKSIDQDEIAAFTEKHFCVVYTAFYNE